MARLEIHAWSGSDAFLVDCQSDLLADLPTRFVIPLVPHYSGGALPRLNPVFFVRGTALTLVPQLATTVRSTELSAPVGSLADHHYEIGAAIDILLSGV